MTRGIHAANKSMLSTAIGFALGGASLSAGASLTTSNFLDAGGGAEILGCAAGGAPPNCNYGFTTTTFTGSWFGMDQNGDGSMALTEHNLIDVVDLIPIGSVVTAYGSHAGTINGSESPAFDIWEFFCNTGMHYLTSPIVEVGTHTGNTASLDFSGWTVTWSGLPAIDMGGGTQDCGTTSDGICGIGSGDVGGIIDNGTGQATIVCSVASCSSSSTFTLDYSAVVARDDPSGFGGVPYALHLEGYVIHADDFPVPLPAAAWLFGSGLVGLVGLARRRTRQH